MAQLKVTYKKSTIGYAHDQKRTVESLGLHKLNQSVLLPDNQAVRGMVFKVRHLVAVEEVAGETRTQGTPHRARTYGEEQGS